MDRLSILVGRLNKLENIFSKSNKSAVLCLLSVRFVGLWNPRFSGAQIRVGCGRVMTIPFFSMILNKPAAFS